MKKVFISILIFVSLFSCSKSSTPLKGFTFSEIRIEGDDSDIVTRAVEEELRLAGAEFDIDGCVLKGQTTWIKSRVILKSGERVGIFTNLIVSISALEKGRRFSALAEGRNNLNSVRIDVGRMSKVEFARACANQIAQSFASQLKTGAESAT